MALFRRIIRRIAGEVVETRREQVLTGEQLAAERARLEEIRRKAWPDGAPPISGCCDRADQR